MQNASKDYIINTVFRTNILPIISECNTSCIFCSHRQNPPEIEVFRMPHLELEDFREIIGYLSPSEKIIIGESATRIIEGEPLLHKDFAGIVTMVRQKYRNTPIQVTTNGILLNNELVHTLEKLGNIDLNISVNCIDLSKRESLLGPRGRVDIRENLSLLKGRIRHTGSFVAVPEIVDRKAIEEIVSFLDGNGAEAVRMFLPGYTSLTSGCDNLHELYSSAVKLADELSNRYTIPVIVEPSFISDLHAKVEGVMRGTPAEQAEIRRGDIIREVNGKPVVTRVDAFNRIFRAPTPLLTIERGDKLFEVRLKKVRNMPSGITVLYDADPELAEDIDLLARHHGAKKVLILTSELAADIIRLLLQVSNITCRYEVVAVESRFFGGTIKCAGLLTIEDLMRAAKGCIDEKDMPDLILVPPSMLDYRRRDLKGVSLQELEAGLGIAADTI